MHQAVADCDVAAPEIGPRLLLQPGKQVEPDLAVRLVVLVDASNHRGERLNQIGAADDADELAASRKGKGKKARSHYPVPISADLAGRLAAPDRPANAPLVTWPNGKPWKRTNHACPFRLMAKACAQDPRPRRLPVCLGPLSRRRRRVTIIEFV